MPSSKHAIEQPFHYRYTAGDETAALKSELAWADKQPDPHAVTQDEFRPIPILALGDGVELHRVEADADAERNSEAAWIERELKES